MEQELIPSSSGYIANQARKFLEEQERTATKAAGRFISEREREVIETRNTALRELADCRDGLEALGHSDLPAAEFTAQLHDLRSRQAQAEAALGKAAEQVEAIEAIEEDPLDWWDSMTERQPSLRTDFPW